MIIIHVEYEIACRKGVLLFSNLLLSELSAKRSPFPPSFERYLRSYKVQLVMTFDNGFPGCAGFIV